MVKCDDVGLCDRQCWTEREFKKSCCTKISMTRDIIGVLRFRRFFHMQQRVHFGTRRCHIFSICEFRVKEKFWREPCMLFLGTIRTNILGKQREQPSGVPRYEIRVGESPTCNQRGGAESLCLVWDVSVSIIKCSLMNS